MQIRIPQSGRCCANPARSDWQDAGTEGQQLAERANQYGTLTPRGAAKLEGSADNVFAKSGVSERVAYEQLGNAVNVGVVRFVTQSLLAGEVPLHRIAQSQSTLFYQ